MFRGGDLWGVGTLEQLKRERMTVNVRRAHNAAVPRSPSEPSQARTSTRDGPTGGCPRVHGSFSRDMCRHVAFIRFGGALLPPAAAPFW